MQRMCPDLAPPTAAPAAHDHHVRCRQVGDGDFELQTEGESDVGHGPDIARRSAFVLDGCSFRRDRSG